MCVKKDGQDSEALAKMFAAAWMEYGGDLLERAVRLGLTVDQIMDVRRLASHIDLEEIFRADQHKGK